MESSSNNDRNRSTALPERSLQNDFNYNIAGERVEQTNGDGTTQLWHGAMGRNINSHDDFPSLSGGGSNRNNLAAQLSKTFGSVSISSDYYSVDRQTNSKSAPPAPSAENAKGGFSIAAKKQAKKDAKHESTARSKAKN